MYILGKLGAIPFFIFHILKTLHGQRGLPAGSLQAPQAAASGRRLYTANTDHQRVVCPKTSSDYWSIQSNRQAKSYMRTLSP